MTGRRTNWAGNVRFGAAERHSPTSIPELQALVARAGLVRAVGGGHSFTDVADTTGALISTLSLPPVLDLDTERASVRVAAGVTYTELARYLDPRGFALRNLASLPHLTVGGACATGTHGSGVGNGSLATAVTELELVTADGDLVTVSGPGAGRAPRRARHRDQPDAGAGAGLRDAPVGAREAPAGGAGRAARRGAGGRVQRERVHRLGAGAGGPGVAQAAGRRAAPAGRSAGPRSRPTDRGTRSVACRPATARRSSASPVPGTTGCRTSAPTRRRAAPATELQSEYLVGRADAVAALHALAEVRDRIHPVLQTCEIRAVAADELWLSPFHQRDSVGLHFTWVDDEAAVLPVVGLVERQLAPYAPRPHWAKIFTAPAGPGPRRLPPAAGLPRAGRRARPGRQVRQRVHRPLSRLTTVRLGGRWAGAVSRRRDRPGRGPRRGRGRGLRPLVHPGRRRLGGGAPAAGGLPGGAAGGLRRLLRGRRRDGPAAAARPDRGAHAGRGRRR